MRPMRPTITGPMVPVVPLGHRDTVRASRSMPGIPVTVMIEFGLLTIDGVCLSSSKIYPRDVIL